MPQLSPMFWSGFPVFMFVMVMVVFSVLFLWQEEKKLLDDSMNNYSMEAWFW